MEGRGVGFTDGSFVGLVDGILVEGDLVVIIVGTKDGNKVEIIMGLNDGHTEGTAVRINVGRVDGTSEGLLEG